MKSSNNAVFELHFHLVLVTKYRKKVITEEIKQRLEEIFEALCKRWNCALIEFGAKQITCICCWKEDQKCNQAS